MPPRFTADVLYRCLVENWAATKKCVAHNWTENAFPIAAVVIRDWCAAQSPAIDCGERRGFPIQVASREELASDNPRIRAFQEAGGRRRIMFSLADGEGFLAALKLAEENGFGLLGRRQVPIAADDAGADTSTGGGAKPDASVRAAVLGEQPPAGSPGQARAKMPRWQLAFLGVIFIGGLWGFCGRLMGDESASSQAATIVQPPPPPAVRPPVAKKDGTGNPVADSIIALAKESAEANDLDAACVYLRFACNPNVPWAKADAKGCRELAAAVKTAGLREVRLETVDAPEYEAWKCADRLDVLSEPHTRIAVNTLYAAFADNNAAANDKYTGERFTVRGTFDGTNEGIGGLDVFLAAGGQRMAGANVKEADREAVVKLRHGQQISVRCTVGDISIVGWLSLRNCVVLH